MKKFLSVLMILILSLALVACGSNTTGGNDKEKDKDKGKDNKVANKAKPLVWYNRQPSNSSTGALDKEALSFNDKTYYVGFDANQGAELQGKMIVEYIQKHKDTIDRNKDGVVTYVLAIGDIGHNDSKARTIGVRKALGTAVEKDGQVNFQPVGTNPDGKATAVKDGKVDNLVIREIASQEMKNAAGATWDASTAGNALNTWVASFGDKIDLVISNNDGMAMAMFNGWSKANKVPTFGYDANNDAVKAIEEGFGGTISQHADVQAYLTLKVLRNLLDGQDVMNGISKADDAGNVLTDKDYKYVAEERSFYALNLAVTAENFKDFLDSTAPFKPVANKLDAAKHAEKKVWLSIYNSADNFLNSSYRPLLEKYDKLLNLKVEYVAGDGQTEANITNRLGNPGEYDAYAINMVKTDNAASYTQILNQ